MAKTTMPSARDEGAIKPPVNLAKYYVTTALLALIGTPLAVSIGMVGYIFGLPLLLPVFVWFLYARMAKLPDSAFHAIMPVVLSFCYYMSVWALVFGLAQYRFTDPLFGGYFLIVTAPYLVINILLAIMGNHSLFPALQVAVLAVTSATVLLTRKICKKRLKYDRRLFICLALVVGLSGVAAYQFFERGAAVLLPDYSVERVEDEVDLSQYRPFDGIAPTEENILTGAYPFTIDVYAVTAGTQNENARKLIDWIISPQGQDAVEQCGYVRN